MLKRIVDGRDPGQECDGAHGMSITNEEDFNWDLNPAYAAAVLNPRNCAPACTHLRLSRVAGTMADL